MFSKTLVETNSRAMLRLRMLVPSHKHYGKISSKGLPVPLSSVRIQGKFQELLKHKGYIDIAANESGRKVSL